MGKIKIISVGKSKEKWLQESCSEYIKRLSLWAEVELIWVRDDAQLIQQTKNEKDLIGLDPEGKQFTSEQFAQFIEQSWVELGAGLIFVIGGAEGLPDELKRDNRLVSLSPMTFTHQMSRLILLEQVYRAFSINHGKSYHK